MKLIFAAIGSLWMIACCPSSSSTHRDHDVQFLQILTRAGKFDMLDTFHGTYQKDLVPGVAKTTMWLTTREQEIILTALERYNFFSLPDTLYRRPAGEAIFPDFGTQMLRVKYNGKEKTVVWDSGIELLPLKKYAPSIEKIMDLITDIVVSKPEYKALPPAKGVYY